MRKYLPRLLSRYLPYLIGAVAFVYLATLAVKDYSWVFVSSDSADFLAASTIWMVPQTYGYPLYILLGHMLNVFPGGLAAKMTVLLSALPAAATVVAVYLIVLRLTKRTDIAIVSSAVLLGTAVFLTEATVTKGYALTAMFLTLAYWSYINEWKYRTVLFLGLGTAVHMLTAAIAVFWLLADRRWKLWLGRPLGVYAAALLPYALIPVLMYLDTPRFLAGSLSLTNFVNYFSSTGRAIIGMMSIFEAPARLWHVSLMILMSLGLAVVPLAQCVKKPLTKSTAVLIATVLFLLWYVVTCLDAQTWTYLSLAAPSTAVLVGLGLSRMSKQHLVAVAASALVLVCVNAAFLNANLLERKYPQGRTYLEDLMTLPDGAVVVAEPGPYSLGLFYAISLNKSLIPLIYPYIEEPLFNVADYGEWLEDKYGVTWTSTLDGVQKCLDSNTLVYYVPVDASPIKRCFVLEERPSKTVGVVPAERILKLTGLQPDKYIKEKE